MKLLYSDAMIDRLADMVCRVIRLREPKNATKTEIREMLFKTGGEQQLRRALNKLLYDGRITQTFGAYRTDKLGRPQRVYIYELKNE